MKRAKSQSPSNCVSEKKNHHFVPQFHLKAFAVGKSGLIWEYDKQRPDVVRSRSIRKHVCWKPFYYEQEDVDGSKSQVFENGLETIEKEAARIILGLHKTGTLENRGKLAFYIASLLVRGPSFRDGCASFIKDSREASMQALFTGDAFPQMPPEFQALLRDNDLRSQLEASVLPQDTLACLVYVAASISESLCRKKWDVFFSDRDFFVTSDTPVIFGHCSGAFEVIGPSHPDTMICCPLRKDMLVWIRPYCIKDTGPYEVRSVSEGQVARINQLMCIAAQRYAYAPVENEDLKSLVKGAKGWSQGLSGIAAGQTAVCTWGIRHSSENGIWHSSS